MLFIAVDDNINSFLFNSELVVHIGVIQLIQYEDYGLNSECTGPLPEPILLTRSWGPLMDN